jgi:hypothetical protein
VGSNPIVRFGDRVGVFGGGGELESAGEPRAPLALPFVGIGSPHLVLREVEDRDLDVLFEHSTDREAIQMAAFTSADPPAVAPSMHAGQD